MDFEKVLYKAQKNEKKKAKEPVKCYRTTFGPPKKEEKTKGLSANIQRFLARKEEEERRKKDEEARKREELLALRNQDNKAKKRVQVMLKRTKSANKSVLVDAIDTVNTADTINGPQQCDEDDYGYVSQEASKFYKQMMEKYSSVPVEEQKSFKPNNKATAKDLINTKDRVKQALQRQEEEENMPHKRKRKRKEDEDEDDDGQSDKTDSEEPQRLPEKPKSKRPAMPPPLDFNSLLKIAEKKQFEPFVMEKKEVKRDFVEPDRLMTKKEKAEYERQKEREKKKSDSMKPSSSKVKSEGENRDQEKNRGKEKERVRENGVERQHEKKREDSDRARERDYSSSVKSSYRRPSPELNHNSRSRSRSRSPMNNRIGKNKQSFNASNSSISSSMKKTKEEIRSNSSGDIRHSSSSAKIPKIPRLNGIDKKGLERSSDRERVKEMERDREKERERLAERERERITQREREREKERQRQREREEKEKLRELEREKERLKEKQRELDRERERLRELERAREKERAKEREKYERERFYDKKEKEPKDALQKRQSTSSEKEKSKAPDSRKASKYDKLDLFGERSSVSPERSKPTSKFSKPQEPIKKISKPERIKIVEDTTKDLFDNPVTLVRKQNPSDKSKDTSKSISSKTEEKAKPSSSIGLSSKQHQGLKSSLEREKMRPPGAPVRRKDAEDDRSLSEKRSRNDYIQSRESKQGAPQQTSSANRQALSKDVKPKQFPPRDLQPKQFPPKDLQRKQFPPRDLKPKQFPPADLRKIALAKKRLEYERSDSEDSDEDEEEDDYDPDLDDFIDDGAVDDQEDYSEYIKKIFNYDKSKYMDEDSDIEESSFAQQMREECRSARLGLLEDLEDMALEQQEKRRKALNKMKRGRRR